MNRRFSAEHIQWPPKKISLSGEDGANPEKMEVEEPLEPIPRFRRILPQVLASTAKNMLLLDLGMTVAFSTIVIPALREGKDSKGLSFTAEEASWFSSVIFICQPLGSILSGAVLDPLGRKKAMMLVNVPHIIGWFLFYISASKLLLFLTAVIMGLGIGFMEAPIITYVGEISEPQLRGTLTSYANLFVTFGFLYIFFIGSLVDWRTAALFSMIVPIVTIVAISQVPETPIWLVSKGRKEDAEKSLCWLRGWVSPQYIKKELEELTNYNESIQLKKPTTNGVVNPGFVSDDGNPVQVPHENEQPTFGEKVKDFVRPGMLKPLGFIVAFFFFSNFTGTTPTRPYMVLLAKEYKMPMDPYKATVVFGAIGFAGSVSCMVTIAKFKKRPIAIVSMVVASFSALSMYLFSDPWVAFVSYVFLTFSSYYGAMGLVWTLVGEVFPFRGRGTASGLAAALSYLISFAATKSFQPLQDMLTLQGIFIFYAIISFIGVIFLYFTMPETEGKPLEDIEKHYNNNKSMDNEKTIAV